MVEVSELLRECEGFEWDWHNAEKNWRRHLVSPAESEEVFFNRPLVAVEDVKHSERENRFYALGQTDAGRRLFVAFTIRGKTIRVISVRDMNAKERKAYHGREKKDSAV